MSYNAVGGACAHNIHYAKVLKGLNRSFHLISNQFCVFFRLNLNLKPCDFLFEASFGNV